MTEARASEGDLELRLDGLSLGLRPGAGGHIAWFRSLPSKNRDAAYDWMRPAPPDSVEPGDSACFPMTPFCNRIDHGRFTYDGRAVTLPRNFAPEEHAIHGLAWRAPWRVAERADHRAVLSFSHDGSVWPWAFETKIAYTLRQSPEGAGLCEIRLETTNRSDAAMPSGFGLHPYFPRRDGALIRAAVDGVIETDAVMMPRQVVAQSKLRDALASGDSFPDGFDNGLEGWDGVAEIRWAKDRARLTLRAPEGFRRAVYYSPLGQDFFCFEPVSHTWNGLNVVPDGCGDGGVVRLAPGESHRADLVLTPHFD